MNWIYLALLAPLLWSIVVLIDDNLLSQVYRRPIFGTIISGLFGALPLLTLLWNSTISTNMIILMISVTCGLLSVVVYNLYFNALDREEPSVVIMLFSLSPALLPIAAHYLVGEELVFHQIIGFVVVLLAGVAISMSDIKKFKISSVFWLIFVAAIITDIVLIGTKYVYENTNFYTGYIYYCVGLGVGGLIHLGYAFANGHNSELSKVLKNSGLKVLTFLVLAELINISAEFVSNLAVSRGQVSIVKVLENIQPLYMILIAVALYPVFPKYFREGVQGKLRFKISMICIMLIGIFMSAPGSF